MIQYNDIFVEVRQRVAAFKYWKEYWGTDKMTSYGKVDQDEYLDEAYRFLYTSASEGFMKFCAKKEGMDFNEYCEMLDVSPEKLIRSYGV